VTSIDHSAAGAAAGFEQQRQLALVLLCEAYARDPAVRVRLEAVEDIDVVSYEVSIDARVQVKHHLSEMTLTDSTPELWRTMPSGWTFCTPYRPESCPSCTWQPLLPPTETARRPSRSGSAGGRSCRGEASQ
jgi:hypothetical protein